MTNLIGKKVELSFLDHSEDSTATIGRCPEPANVLITLTGWVLAENKDYYLIEVVRCNAPGNSVTWSVLKAVILDCREVKDVRIPKTS